MTVAMVLKDYDMVHSRRPEPVNFGLAVDVPLFPFSPFHFHSLPSLKIHHFGVFRAQGTCLVTAYVVLFLLGLKENLEIQATVVVSECTVC